MLISVKVYLFANKIITSPALHHIIYLPGFKMVEEMGRRILRLRPLREIVQGPNFMIIQVELAYTHTI